MKLLPEGTGGLLGNLGGLLSGLTGAKAGGESSPVTALLGPGANAIGGALSRALGFNVTPLLAMAAPALLGLLSKAVKSDKLDASGLASMLGHERDAFASNPANKETVALVTSAMASGDQAAATIAAYGESWKYVAAGPAAALFLVSTCGSVRSDRLRQGGASCRQGLARCREQGRADVGAGVGVRRWPDDRHGPAR